MAESTLQEQIELTAKQLRVVTAAIRKVEADDAIFLAQQGKAASNFVNLVRERKDADHELQVAVRDLD